MNASGSSRSEAAISMTSMPSSSRLRAGVEATISQGVRAFDLRRSRYVGMPKTHLQHLAIATAINLVRLVGWLDGTPLAPTRVSAFERLYQAA
ncbi:MAG TPA: transposase [Ktedonobacteraceae bacterium]|nr:transposase [Ktedonobacteraceae bacterium]